MCLITSRFTAHGEVKSVPGAQIELKRILFLDNVNNHRSSIAQFAASKGQKSVPTTCRIVPATVTTMLTGTALKRTAYESHSNMVTVLTI